MQLNDGEWLRLSCFFGVFVIITIWETLYPKRTSNYSKRFRWSNNLCLMLTDTFFLKLSLPVVATGAALYAETNKIGLFNLFSWHDAIIIVSSIVILDFILYSQHYLFHKIPLLWRLHRVHHSDLHVDVTTGVRFHPFEIVISMLIKIATVLVLGIPATAVLLFEIILNATSLFNHGNLRMPKSLDNLLRFIVVTPDMHRIHHSVIRRETDSNFGFNLSCWDRLCGTYKDQPAHGQKNMVLGLDLFRSQTDSRIDRLLIQPFRKPKPDQETQ